MTSTVLVTGANGFVGLALCRYFKAQGWTVRAATRAPHSFDVDVTNLPGMALLPNTDWRVALASCDVVVHVAARVHVMHEVSDDPLAEFRRVNVEASVALAQQAAAMGVRRFVFVSSVKVLGDSTAPGLPFSAASPISPTDAYGRSKAEAEWALHEVAVATGMELVVVRLPLVYGPGVKANFAAMVEVVRRGVPLPLSGIRHNRRSLLCLDNLVDFFVACADHPKAAGQVFLVSDDDDVSTAELLTRIGLAVGRPARLFFVPQGLLAGAARAVGRMPEFERLSGSLQVDISHARNLLGWSPPLNLDQALGRMAKNS